MGYVKLLKADGKFDLLPAEGVGQIVVSLGDDTINVQYVNGDKIPDATLKKGFALIEMGKQSQGVRILKGLVSNFPLTEEASLAQQKIREVSE